MSDCSHHQFLFCLLDRSLDKGQTICGEKRIAICFESSLSFITTILTVTKLCGIVSFHTHAHTHRRISSYFFFILRRASFVRMGLNDFWCFFILFGLAIWWALLFRCCRALPSTFFFSLVFFFKRKFLKTNLIGFCYLRLRCCW